MWEEKDLDVITINILMLLAISQKLVTSQNILKVKWEKKNPKNKKPWIQHLTTSGKA